jgi:hypothetical protein
MLICSFALLRFGSSSATAHMTRDIAL